MKPATYSANSQKVWTLDEYRTHENLLKAFWQRIGFEPGEVMFVGMAPAARVAKARSGPSGKINLGRGPSEHLVARDATEILRRKRLNRAENPE